MGSKVSGLYRKIWWDDDQNNTQDLANSNVLKCKGSIFILKRVSSMFFNEDGDLAHEFYEEVKCRKRKRSKMRKIDESLLIPQGEVDLKQPNINPDMPVILCQV